MKRIIWIFFVLFAFNIVSAQAKASIDLYKFSDDTNRVRYLDLTKQLRCPKCQNQDIADSNAPIATDMRKAVHRLLEEGKSNEQIVKFMTDRFGEFVSYKPKVIPATYILWYGPWLFIFFGIVVIVLMVRLRSKAVKSNRNEQAIDSTQKKQVEALLSQYSRSKKDDE